MKLRLIIKGNRGHVMGWDERVERHGRETERECDGEEEEEEDERGRCLCFTH